MSSNVNVCVIIPAAGRSARFGESDKLAQDLGGRSVLVRTVELFTKRDEIKSILVAGPPDSFQEFKEKYGPTLSFHGATLVEGGRDHRWETVRNALEDVPDDASHVAVHDAARPNVSKQVFDRVFQAAKSFDAVFPVVPINGTVKRVNEDITKVSATDDDAVADLILGDAGRVTVDTWEILETIDRTGLVEIQTPQLFSADLLKKAYAQADLNGVTDDASVVERFGEKVYAVAGDVRNIKITTPADLQLMRAILGVRPPAERAAHKRF